MTLSYTYSATAPDCWWEGSTEVYKDAGSTPAVAGTDTVQQWNDARGVGTGYSLSQSTSGQRPSYLASIKNSLPGIKFVKSSHNWLTCGYSSEPATIIAVIRYDGSGFFDGIASADCSATTHGPAWMWMSSQVDSKHRFARLTSADDDVLSNGYSLKAGDLLMSSGTTYLLGCRLDASAKLVENWNMPRGARGNATSSNSLRAINGGMALGSFYYNHSLSGNESNITVCELLVWSTRLSDDEMAQVQKALFIKYGFGAATTTPDYLLSCFTGVGDSYEANGETLRVFESTDGLAWHLRPSSYNPGSGEKTVRDPSIIQPDLTDNNTYWLVHTINHDFAGTASTSFQVAKSTDGGFLWSVVGTVDCSAVVSTSGARCWAPEWFRDASAPQGMRVFFTGSSNSPSSFAIYETHPTNSAFTTWSTPVAVTGSAISVNVIDPFLYTDGAGNWYLWCKDENASPASYVVIYKSTTDYKSGFNTGLRTGDWASWGAGIYEGETFIVLNNGTRRVWIDNPASGHGINYSDQATGDLFSGSVTMTTPAGITHDCDIFSVVLRHGTVIYGPPPPPTAVEPWFLEKRNFSGGMLRRFGGGMQR